MAKSWIDLVPRAAPDPEALAALPYMGQTATFGDTPFLIVGHDPDKGWQLESADGDKLWMKNFAPDDSERTEGNALVAASRTFMPEGTDVEGVGTVGGLHRDDEGEWWVRTRVGKVIDLAQVVRESEFDQPGLDAGPTDADLMPPEDDGPDLRCPNCGSPYVALGPSGFVCQNCGTHGDVSELSEDEAPVDEDHDTSFDQYPDEAYPADDRQAAKEAAPMALPSVEQFGYPEPGVPEPSMIEIGEPEKEYEVIPLHLPATTPAPEPSQPETPAPVEPEKVPAGAPGGAANYHFHFHNRVSSTEGDPVRGWKVLRVAADGSLHSPERAAEWPGDTAIDGGASGIYALASADDERFSAYASKECALVRVALWGHVAEHESGVRGQYAYPEEVLLPKTPAAEFLAGKVSGRYPNVPVRIVEDEAFMKGAETGRQETFECSNCGNTTTVPNATDASDLPACSECGEKAWKAVTKEARGVPQDAKVSPDNRKKLKGDSPSDREDAINDPVKCDNCGSHTIELTNSDDGEFHCLACGHHFKTDQIEVNPKARPKKSSRYVEDTNGEPLRTGQYYNLHGSKFKVPDVVKVIDLGDGTITAQANESPVPLRITLADVEDEGYSFEPIEGFTNETHLHFFGYELEGEVKEAGPGGMGNVYPIGGPNGGPLSGEEESPTRGAELCPRCGREQPAPHSPCPACNHGLDTADQGERLPKPAPPTTSKTARRSFTPSQQRELVEEPGVARNRDKLNLEGTHYQGLAESAGDDDLALLFL